MVTEYHHHSRQDLAIEVEYFEMDKLRSQFEELLRGYRDYRSLDSNDMLPEERQDLKKRADLATNTFQAAFRGQLSSNRNTLNSTPIPEAINTMMSWATQIMPRHAHSQPLGPKEYFADVRDWPPHLQTLTTEVAGAGQSSLWPFICKIRYVHLLEIETSANHF